MGACALAFAALAACRASEVSEPELARLREGTYVLTELGSGPVPFVYFEVNYADTLTAALRFAFDTVRIVDDTTFSRHFRREAVMIRGALPAVVVDSEVFRYSGVILHRQDEVKLTTRQGSPGGVAISYFVPRDSGLARHTSVTRFFCLLECTLVSDRLVDAWYARR